MKIVSWNVNGIRAAHKKGFCSLVSNWEADMVCVQETKAHREQVEAEVHSIDGMQSFWSAATRKGYSGVATWSKRAPLAVSYGIGESVFDSEGRFVVTTFEDFVVYNVYFPNGGSGVERHEFKQKFLKLFLSHLKSQMGMGKELIVLGDYNIAHKEIDVFDPIRLSSVSGFLPEEREWLDTFFESGFVDLFRKKYPNSKDKYTWWDMRSFARVNNRGWRIDYICSTVGLAERIKNIEIWDHVEGSDHCPVMLEF